MSKTINAKRIMCALLVTILVSFTVFTLITRASAATSTPMGGDMTTNIPDTDIGGATGGMNTTNTPATSRPDSQSTTDKDNESTPGAEITTPLATTAPESTPSVTTTARTTKATTPEQTTNTPVDTSDGRGWIIAVIIVSIIAAIIIAVIALMPGKRDKDS